MPKKNENKTILHLCSGIGSDSQPYKDNGYNVVRIGKGNWGRKLSPPPNVYGIIANPPCTEFSFAKTNSKKPRNLEKGMFLVKQCLRIIWECQVEIPYPTAKKTNLQFWMLENPFGFLRRFLGHPTLVYQPFEYGDNYKKKTCVWGFFNIPKKNPIECTMPKFDRLKTNQIHYKGNEHLTRQERRSISSPSFCKAFYRANK